MLFPNDATHNQDGPKALNQQLNHSSDDKRKEAARKVTTAQREGKMTEDDRGAGRGQGRKDPPGFFFLPIAVTRQIGACPGGASNIRLCHLVDIEEGLVVQ